MLASGESTGFRMNVDGRKGSSFNNVGILANDSMYVFVEVTVDPNGGNQPLLIQDSRTFHREWHPSIRIIGSLWAGC